LLNLYKSMEKKDYNFKKLFALIRLEHAEINAIYVYAILGGLIKLSLPLGIQSILGFVLGGSMVTSVYLLIFLIILGIGFVGILQINQMKIIEKIQQKIFVRYSLAIAKHLPNANYQMVEQQYLPHKINYFFDTANVQKGISKLLLDIPMAIIQIVFGLALLSFYHSSFLIFAFILSLILWLVLKFSSKKGLSTSIEESNYKYKLAAWLEEIGRSISHFKQKQHQDFHLKKTDAYLLKYLNSRTDHFKLLLFQFKSLVVFKITITALMLILGTYLLLHQKINVGQFVAAEIVIISIIAALEKLIVSLENVYDVCTGLYKVDSLVELPAEKIGKHELLPQAPLVELHQMSFKYPNGDQIFKHFNLKLQPNSITCIMGNENAGKSTLLKLLAGLYSHFEGEISINKTSIRHYNLQQLRQNMALLYEKRLFEASLYDNICMGNDQIEKSQILNLCQTLGFDDFISQFPDAFEHMIHPLGGNLSSSNVSKILLLRSLIEQSPLILLDEPFKSLDPNSKNAVQNYLLDLAQHSTIVVISNDLHFAQLAHQSIDLNLNH
jgi:ATP-binding cassette, subfamily B, bacterial